MKWSTSTLAASEWPQEVLDAVDGFQQGDLIPSPAICCGADAAFGVWNATRSAAVEADAPLEERRRTITIDQDQFPDYGIITSQTCDVSGEGHQRKVWFQIAPIVEVPRDTAGNVRRGKVPYLYPVPEDRIDAELSAGATWAADLRLEVPLEKSYLVGQRPIPAFNDEAERLAFASRLGAIRSRPVLGGAASSVIVPTLRDRLHKRNTDPTLLDRIIDQVDELRLAVSPSRVEPTSGELFVFRDNGIEGLDEDVQEWFLTWWDDARATAADQGFALRAPRFTSHDDTTAAVYRKLVPLDFDYLCPDE